MKVPRLIFSGWGSDRNEGIIAAVGRTFPRHDLIGEGEMCGGLGTWTVGIRSGMSQSINQSVSQSFSQSLVQSVSQSVSQSGGQF